MKSPNNMGTITQMIISFHYMKLSKLGLCSIELNCWLKGIPNKNGSFQNCKCSPKNWQQGIIAIKTPTQLNEYIEIKLVPI